MSEFIKAENISKTYKKGKVRIAALKPCSISLPQSGLVLLTGETGSGKSTLLTILSGLEKPTCGKVYCKADNYAAFAFQNSTMIDSLTLEQNINYILRLYPDDTLNADGLLQKFRLSERKDNYPCELSGGEKQRAALLSAVLQNKPAIFADEPTANLDSEHAREIADLLKELSETRLVVTVTHNLEFFEGIADRTIKMCKGEIIYDETKNAPVIDGGTQDFQCGKPHFLFKEAAKMAVLSAKKSKLRLCCLFFSLLIAFLGIVTFTNNLFSAEYMRIYTALKSQNAVCMDFAQTNEYGTKKIAWNQTREICDTYNASYFIDNEDDCYFTADGNIVTYAANVSRLYVNDECTLNMLAGNAALGEGDVAISDCIAQQLITKYSNSYGVTLTYDTLIGCLLDDRTISAVYSTNYDGESINSNNEIQYQTIFISWDTYLSETPDWFGTFIKYKTIYSDLYVFGDGYSLLNYSLLYGEQKELSDGEIYISDKTAALYAPDTVLSELTGTKIVIPFMEVAGYPVMNNVLNVSDNEYTIAGVYSSGYGYNTIIMNGYDYADVYFNYSQNFLSVASGISVAGCDKNVIKTLLADGFSDCSFTKDGVVYSYIWLQSTERIAIMVSTAFAVIALILMINFIGNVTAKNTREMGALRALGVSVNKTASIYILQCLFCLVVTFAISLIAQFAFIAIWNLIISAAGTAARLFYAPIVYYSPQVIGIAAAIMAFYLLTACIIIAVKLKQKSATDLIYER